jgi:2-hydroxy-4-carboxymuconate semialdehyde hemiacetal dehydrogenase
MKPLRVALAGVGAFGTKHLQAIARIDGAEVAALVGRDAAKTRAAAERFGVRAADSLDEVLADASIDAVILCTPTPLHASQAIACLQAGKHVQVEIPLADSLQDAEAVLDWQQRSGRVAMCGHTRRFNPSHQWVQRRVAAGEFALQQLEVQTFFMRRSNINLQGEARSWTDHLLWHHAAHTVDLFAWQAASPVVQANALQGPRHPVLGIAMDMSIQLQAANGALCTLSLSFNSDGPQGSVFRYIGDSGTYVARYDALYDGKDQEIDVSGVDVAQDGIELQDREFFAAIREGRAPRANVADVLPCYRVLHALEMQLNARPAPGASS